MKTIKGPGIFLAQFLGDEAPFNTLDGITQYMADLGYKGVQLPIWDPRIIDIKLAAESQTYADELKGKLQDKGLEIITESGILPVEKVNSLMQEAEEIVKVLSEARKSSSQ